MQNREEETPSREVIGIIPMAGRAARLDRLPCSKEIFPIGGGSAEDTDQGPRVVCEHLLTKMRAAGIGTAYAVLRKGKWDIPAYLGDGSEVQVRLAYLMMGLPYGTPYSVDQAFPFVRQATVALGFPDMVFGPEDIFTPIIEHQRSTAADIVLGLFPADRPEKVDMVALSDDGEVQRIIIKPGDTELRRTWGVAVWAPSFTEFMHEFLLSHRHTAAESAEIFVGDIVQAAIDKGLRVRGVQVSEQPYRDIGTRNDLREAMHLPPGA
jgi:glucose-1-phosphate thymidylyltransferase